MRDDPPLRRSGIGEDLPSAKPRQMRALVDWTIPAHHYRMSGRLPGYSLADDCLLQRIGCVAILCAYSDTDFAKKGIGAFVELVSGAIRNGDLTLVLNSAHQPRGAILPGHRLFPFGEAQADPTVELGPAHPVEDQTGGIGVYDRIGAALMLLALSDYHRPHPVNTYVHIELIPPLQADQFHIHRDAGGQPAALLTWARLSAEIERDIHQTARSLMPSEWQSGDRLFFNDFVAPRGALRGLVTEMKTQLFPTDRATSFRRRADGSPPQLCHWHGPQADRIKPAPPAKPVAFAPNIASPVVPREDRLE